MLGSLAGQAGSVAIIIVGSALMLAAAFIAGAEAYGLVPALAVGGALLSVLGILALLGLRRRALRRPAERQDLLPLVLAGAIHLLPAVAGAAIRLIAKQPGRTSLVTLGALAAYHLLTQGERPKT